MTESKRIHVTDQDGAADTVAALLLSARRSADILSPVLDPRLYDRSEVLQALRSMVVDAGRYAQVRILVADPDAIAARGHQLIELSRQLSSYIEIRRLSEDDRNEDIAMLVADRESYLYWGPGSGYVGNGQWHSRGACRRHSQRFQDCWDRSEPAPVLRRLHI